MMMLQMDGLQYGINPNDQILYDDADTEYKLILCLNESNGDCWIVKINDQDKV